MCTFTSFTSSHPSHLHILHTLHINHTLLHILLIFSASLTSSQRWVCQKTVSITWEVCTLIQFIHNGFLEHQRFLMQNTRQLTSYMNKSNVEESMIRHMTPASSQWITVVPLISDRVCSDVWVRLKACNPAWPSSKKPSPSGRLWWAQGLGSSYGKPKPYGSILISAL